jgi:hypothetical protein
MRTFVWIVGLAVLLSGTGVAQIVTADGEKADPEFPSDALAARRSATPFSLPNGATVEGPVLLEALGVSVYHAGWDDSAAGTTKIWFLADGTLVDMEAMRALNAQAHEADHGKYSPTLGPLAASSGADERIPAVVWLHSPPTDWARVEFSESMETLGALGLLDSGARATLRQGLHDAIRGVIEPVTAAAAARYRQAGVEVVSIGAFVPVVFVIATPEQLAGIALEREVESIDWAGQVYEDRLDTAVPTVLKNYFVHNAVGGNTGTGARVCVVEGSRVCTTNPCMTVTNDNGVGSVGAHTTGVGSCIRSTDPTFRGIAPGSMLYSAAYSGSFVSGSTNVTMQMPGVISAVDWANNTALADIMNMSFGAGTPTSTVSSFDRYLDWVIRNNAVSIAIACGNSGAFAGDPGAGFNQLSIGSTDDGDNTGWADDAISSFSSWQNPTTGVEVPVAVAPGCHVSSSSTMTMLSCAAGMPCATGYSACGTSFSSPIVAGAAALLVSEDPTLGGWPEPVRAVLMATAWNNIEGSATLSSMDGAGSIDANAAWRVVDAGRYNFGTLVPGSFSGPPPNGEFTALTVNVPAGRKVRACLSWDSNPSRGPAYASNPLQADLDLRVYGPSGTLVASSLSGIQPFEVVRFIAGQGGNYQVRIQNFSFAGASEFYGVALSISDDI